MTKRRLPISSSSSYRSRSRYRAGSRPQKANPLAVGATLCFSLVVALVVGRSLDHRLSDQRARGDSKASLNTAQVEQSSVDSGARRTVEEISEVSGRPLLSLDRWLPTTSVVVDGVEVGSMMNQPLYLRNSLARGYALKHAVVDAVWQRSDGFLDLLFGEGANGATLLRFSPYSVEAFFRSRNGTLVSIGKTGPRDRDSSCSAFEVNTSDAGVTLTCNGSSVLSLPPTVSTQGRLAVASNLTYGEVRDLVVDGSVGEVEFKDQR